MSDPFESSQGSLRVDSKDNKLASELSVSKPEIEDQEPEQVLDLIDQSANEVAEEEGKSGSISLSPEDAVAKIIE